MKYIFSFLTLFSSMVYAINEDYGTFILVKGKVVVLDDKDNLTAAKVDSKVSIGATIITDADSRAKIVIFENRNVINILPNTKLKIVKISNTAQDKNINLNLIQGRVRSNVGDKFDNKSSKFEIRTPTAVAGVRGTQFITSYTPETKSTEIITIHGSVIVKSFISSNIDEKDLPEVVVSKREKSDVNEGSAPSEPTKVPKREFEAIERETNIEKDRDQGRNRGGPGRGGRRDGPGSAPGGSGGAETNDDAGSGGYVNTNPTGNTGGTLPGSGTGSTQPTSTPVKINIK